MPPHELQCHHTILVAAVGLVFKWRAGLGIYPSSKAENIKKLKAQSHLVSSNVRTTEAISRGSFCKGLLCEFFL